MTIAAIKVYNEANTRVAIVEVPSPVRVVPVTPNSPRVVVIGRQGPRGTPAALPAIYFSYGDATPAVIHTPDTDRVVSSVSLVVLEAFDGIGAKVSIGTAGRPHLLLDEDETDLSAVSTYESNPMERVLAGTRLKIFITPGAGATRGRGMLLIEFADA